MFRDLFRRTDATDAAAVDLDEADTATLQQMARHEGVVRALAAGEADGPALPGECGMSVMGVRRERFLKPGGGGLEHWQSGGGRIDILTEDPTGIHQQHTVRPDTVACCHNVVGILGATAMGDQPPAEPDGAEPGAALRPSTLERLLRGVAEGLRGIGRLGVALRIAQQGPDGSIARLPSRSHSAISIPDHVWAACRSSIES